MDCRRLENRLEALVEDALPAAERLACEAHIAGCASCRELFMLASLELPPPGTDDDAWVGEVLARTSAIACEENEAAICALVDGTLAYRDRERLELHLAGCEECSALAGTLDALARELPAMAHLQPDEGFVERVLAQTLPVHVRLKRYWRRTWPRWLHRPRFAAEAAYVGLLALVLVFATPGSPLAAVPRKALETVQSDPREALSRPVEAVGQHFESALEELQEGEAARTAVGWYAAGEEALERARATASELEERLEISWGTLRGEIASLLGKAETSASEPAKPNEEKP